MDPETRRPHLVRGTLASLIATFVALFFHVAGGGELPSQIGLGIALVLSWAVCVLLAGRRHTLVRLSGSVLVSQALFHLLFSFGAGRALLGSTPSAGATAHAHTAIPVADTASASGDALAGDAAQHSSHLAAHLTGSADGAMMWASHAIAALVTIALLHRGEAALRRVLAAAAAEAQHIATWVTEAVSAPAPLPAAPRHTGAAHEAWRVHARRLGASLRLRGPPRALASTPWLARELTAH